MESSTRSTQVFDVFLRLRPSLTGHTDRFLDVEATSDPDKTPQFVTIQPPANDQRKRAVEQFAFTKIFEEQASQLDLFEGTGILSLIDGVLGAEGRSRDGLLATLGVTGSGKSHTILGSKSQRGLTQLSLDCIFQSISHNIVHPTCANSVFPSLAASDVSEAQMLPASVFLDSVYGDGQSTRGSCSRAQTPMLVCSQNSFTNSQRLPLPDPVKSLYPDLTEALRDKSSHVKSFLLNPTLSSLKKGVFNSVKDSSYLSIPVPSSSRQRIPRVSTMPQSPSVDGFQIPVDHAAEYVLVVSMYEVYNDRIFDLLATSSTNGKHGPPRRRALLFKSTEMSPDRKVVAGLKKIVCCTLEEALMVLETGLTERRVAGTGSNAVSSRSHGFFCVEVKKRNRIEKGRWIGSTLTIVDLAGSERARNAKTAGATLAEAGKINESLMYLGQCMQMQSDRHDGATKTIVPFRQCKLTELLFSNSFPSAHINASHHHNHTQHYHQQRNPQKAIMIVTADACGDFNATSQILRYSALAREVCVPRIPSVTSQILQSGIPSTRPGTRDGPSPTSTALLDELEQKERDIARLEDELEIVAMQFEEERARREAAESSWSASEERLVAMEQEIRDECFEEMNRQMENERRRWQAAIDEQADQNDERLDAKVEIITRAIDIHEDDDAKPSDESLESRLKEMEEDNKRLREHIEVMERERLLKTPSAAAKKQRVLKAKKWEAETPFESP